jgi:hypothetical protein
MESLDIYGVYAEILWAEARIARLERRRHNGPAKLARMRKARLERHLLEHFLKDSRQARIAKLAKLAKLLGIAEPPDAEGDACR